MQIVFTPNVDLHGHPTHLHLKVELNSLEEMKSNPKGTYSGNFDLKKLERTN